MKSGKRNFGWFGRSWLSIVALATMQLHAAVVGTGTAGSCTEAALDSVLSGNPATVTFNCGGAGVTITLSTSKTLSVTTTVDGGNLITLDGNNVVRQLHVTGSGTNVTLRGLTFVNGAGAPALNTTGGAVNYNSNGTLTIDTVTFSNNHSTNGGGAIEIDNGALVVTASTFANNSATGFGAGGGAIESLVGTSVAVTNSTFVGNGAGASTSGAAIEVAGAPTFTVTNSTFNANNGNGAVEADAGVTMTLTNTIVAGTTNGPNCRTFSTGTIVDGGGNLQFGGNGANSCGAGVSTVDPVLGALANNGGPTQTQALGAGSAAIDAGNDATCPAVDQRGTARPLGAHCDVGAFEAPAAVLLAPAITNGPPPGGVLGTAYSFSYTSTGSGVVNFAVTSGALPNGLGLSAAGAITGTPTQAGTFTGVVTASNGTLPDATQAFSIVIAAPVLAPTITNGPPPGGALGTPYSFTYTSTGSGVVNFAVTSGALPNGLSLSAAGAITGTPTQPGTFAGVVTASNGTLPDATQAFSIVIPAAAVAPAITNGPPPGGALGTGYSFTYTSTGSGVVSFSVSSGALPNGLSLSAAGAITGTPTLAGTFTGVVTASNGTLPNATQAFLIVITAPVVASAAVPAPTLGQLALWILAILICASVAIAQRTRFPEWSRPRIER